MEDRAKNHLIQKEQVLDTIEIAKAIVDYNLEGKKLTTKPEEFEYLDTYTIEIKDKLIKDYKEKYQKTPNLILNDFIDYYIKKKGLNIDFESNNFHFVGHFVNSHTWACITTKKKDPKIKERKVSHYSQLYISINSFGIKFGFSYGHQVKNSSEIVKRLLEDQELRENLLKKVNESNALGFYYTTETPVLAKSKDALVISNQDELKSAWNENILITQNIFETDIPENISEQIESCFDNLLELLLKTSKIENIMGTLKQQCTKIINEETENHSELNHDRILEILELIINKMNEKGINKTPKVVVLTAAVIWHNVLNRAGDNEYIMQSSLEEMLDGSLNATRYLRGELGIDARSYENIEEFIADLEKEITIKEQKFKGPNDFPKWNDVRKFINEEIIGRKITNESIISTSTFLYFNEKAYLKIELWEANKEFIDYIGDTPAATFNTELSRYSDNSDAQNKRTPLLFTITNLGETKHKLQLIPQIREKIDIFCNEIEEEQWICPKILCSHKKIEITRNNNIIDTGTWKNLITHFLQHLNQQIKYFGPSTVEKFLEESSENLLSEDDNEIIEYERASEPIWKNRMRSALAQLRIDRYIDTDKFSDDPTFKAHFRSRRRTEKFLDEFQLYNDWSDVEKPFVWQMIKEAAENLEGIFSIQDIKHFIFDKFGYVNEKTINAQIIVCTVNHDSRIHYPENKNPRIANSQYDFLYRIEKGKGLLDLYDPERHGKWEIKEDSTGNLIVSMKETFFDFTSRNILPKILLSLQEIREVRNLLISNKQIILYGPPGTGKTYFAEVLAQEIAKDRYELIQFHSSYSYEDFIETIEVIPTPDGESVLYKPKSCVFRNLCKEASSLEENEYVILIIDEINRGDLSRIFGELILGLEVSNRNKEIRTPLSGTLGNLKIPPNLLIIGTMNSVDRSIAIVDYALRRRFLFYKMMPKISILENWLEEKSVENEDKQEILNLFKNLNEKIKRDEAKLGKHHQIGHTYFFVETIEELNIAWKYKVKPLLQEYLNFKKEDLKPYKYGKLIKIREENVD